MITAVAEEGKNEENRVHVHFWISLALLFSQYVWNFDVIYFTKNINWDKIDFLGWLMKISDATEAQNSQRVIKMSPILVFLWPIFGP